MAEETYKQYDHAPPHLFRPRATYMVTAGTYGRVCHMLQPERRRDLVEALRRLLDREGWALLAWVILPNHYHVLVEAPETGGDALSRWIADLHKYTARRWNQEDGARGRKVWWNYWDTCITRERSFWARLNYVHWNPVRHGLADWPAHYPFSSYRQYLALEGIDLKALEASHPFDRVRVRDDF
ncbi:MAG: transposase [Armatimonadota bacterium]